MDALTFIVEIADIMAWPIFGCFLLFILRDDISKILFNIKRVKHKDTIIDFDNNVLKASESIKEIPGLNITTDIKSENNELALLSPRGAIIEGWLEVEGALKEFNKRHNIQFKDEQELGISRNIMQILDYDVLDKQTVMFLANLRKLRNDAVHLDDSGISTDSAISYKYMAKLVINAINKA